MKLRHEFEWREGEQWWDLYKAMEQIPDDAINASLSIQTEWRGYGPSESEEPYLVLSWETE